MMIPGTGPADVSRVALAIVVPGPFVNEIAPAPSANEPVPAHAKGQESASKDGWFYLASCEVRIGIAEKAQTTALPLVAGSHLAVGREPASSSDIKNTAG